MLARDAAAGLIVGYQRYVSPWKGYRCAYRAAHGGPSCSEFARRLVLRGGIWRMVRMMPARFAQCHQAAWAFASMHDPDLDEPGEKPTAEPPQLPGREECALSLAEIPCQCCGGFICHSFLP
jgi:putative component of membrane protein insertase Oxa1/YidC/SpoIIIJ protein YidD